MNRRFPRNASLTLSRALVLLLLWPILGAAQVQDQAEQGDNFGEAVASGDFDGDGLADLAVGVHREDVDGLTDAGAVNVLYGAGASGLDDAGDQFWTQNSAGIFDTAEAGDEFGLTLAAGDFDGDGFDDLAIGVPGESIGGLDAAGAVNVIYGSASGLLIGGNQVWSQNSASIEGGAETDDAFGSALTAGDFDGDGFDDLAVGVPGEGLSGFNDAGAVNVIYGSAGTGLTATGDQVWHKDVAGVLDTAAASDAFGSALAAGDFDDDNRDDLAIGVPLDSHGAVSSAGSVSVLYGSAGVGLTATDDQHWYQSTPDVLDVAEAGDGFGRALAAGNFDGDGDDDLAIGVPLEDVGAIGNAGAINVLYGSAGPGLTATGDQFLHQDSGSIPGTAEDQDQFGIALAAGNFDGLRATDLAVGVHFEFVGSLTAAGAANVLYGGRGGLSAGGQIWHQDVAGVLDQSESEDYFGVALAAGDFDNDGADDLAAGAWGEGIGIASFAGAVNVLYGGGTGLTATGDQFWYQGSTGTSLLAGEDGEPEGTSASLVTEAPVALALLPAAPNPFAGQTTLRFALPASGTVRLTIYDALGREVTRLVDETREAGSHTVAFDAGTLPSGTYLVRLEAAGQVLTERLTRVR